MAVFQGRRSYRSSRVARARAAAARRGASVVREFVRPCGSRMRRSPPRVPSRQARLPLHAPSGRGVPPALARAMAARRHSAVWR